METLKSSFEDVADWCERHLETQRGREIGMTFGRDTGLRSPGRSSLSASRREAGCQDAGVEGKGRGTSGGRVETVPCGLWLGRAKTEAG